MSLLSWKQEVQHPYDTQAARGLGWASLLIGAMEIFAPRKLERAMGIGNGQNTGILRALGVREMMHGVDILSHDDPTPGVWARVAGDALDTVLLGAAAFKTRKPTQFLAIAASVMAIGALDMIFAKRLSED